MHRFRTTIAATLAAVTVLASGCDADDGSTARTDGSDLGPVPRTPPTVPYIHDAAVHIGGRSIPTGGTPSRWGPNLTVAADGRYYIAEERFPKKGGEHTTWRVLVGDALRRAPAPRLYPRVRPHAPRGGGWAPDYVAPDGSMATYTRVTPGSPGPSMEPTQPPGAEEQISYDIAVRLLPGGDLVRLDVSGTNAKGAAAEGRTYILVKTWVQGTYQLDRCRVSDGACRAIMGLGIDRVAWRFPVRGI